MASLEGDTRKCNACETALTSGPGDDYLRCPECGFITRKHIPSADDVDELFSESYFKGNEYADYLRERDSLEENFRSRVESLLNYIDAPKTKRLFEIGCAYGFFLNTAKGHFAALRGIDISRSAVEYGQTELGLDMESGDYLDTASASDFDIFCIWDSIPVIREPERYISKMADDITQGGLLAVSCGDVGSLNARMRGTNWRIIRQKTILHNFTRKSLTILLERHGFQVIDVLYPGVRRSVRAICRGVLGPDYETSLIGRLITRLGLMDKSIILNLHDMMTVIAVRR
ncbi:MAG: methyltransferase domain-containing protein [Rhodospirillales bacterium]